MSSYSKHSRNYALIGTLILLAVVAVFGYGCHSFYAEDALTVKIEDKESVAKDKGHEYRVYTDQGTFVVKDSWIKTRFASGDDYRKLEVGQTYDCNKFGWRIPFFSSFENLIGCKPAR